MPATPVIGIVPESVDQLADQLSPGWLLGQRYVEPLIALGAAPWIMPMAQGATTMLEAIYARLDGLYLAGGADIDPAMYGAARDPLCGRSDPARDWTEMQLLRWAVRDGKPVLGVCRGLQMINVAAGGTLFQDVPTQFPGALAHDETPSNSMGQRERPWHKIQLAPNSRLRAILGGEEVLVNSIHHQGIKDLAPGLRATALTSDGLIEGIESKHSPYLIGVQWHPEEMMDAGTAMKALFESFLEATVAKL